MLLSCQNSHTFLFLSLLKTFQKEQVDPLQLKLQQVNGLGQGLIQSAGKNCDVQGLEHDMEDINARWNTLNKKVSGNRRLPTPWQYWSLSALNLSSRRRGQISIAQSIRDSVQCTEVHRSPLSEGWNTQW